MYEVYVVERGADGAQKLRHHSYCWTATAALRQQWQLEDAGMDACWIDQGRSIRALLGWVVEQVKRRRWLWWLFLLLV
jgi:hypothetical protein